MDTLQYVTSASVTGEGCDDGDGVCLSMTQQPPSLQPFTILSCLHPNYLRSEQGNSGCGETRDSESTGTSTFLPRNKTIVC